MSKIKLDMAYSTIAKMESQLDAAIIRETALRTHKNDYVKASEEARIALQKRLTVAEQLLRETLPHLRFCKGMGRKFAEKLDGLDLRIEAVLKPASGCEHSFHYFGDYPRRRCNNCNALEVVAEGEGS